MGQTLKNLGCSGKLKGYQNKFNLTNPGPVAITVESREFANTPQWKGHQFRKFHIF